MIVYRLRSLSITSPITAPPINHPIIPIIMSVQDVASYEKNNAESNVGSINESPKLTSKFINASIGSKPKMIPSLSHSFIPYSIPRLIEGLIIT